MKLGLGIDTGGTYTDGVIYDFNRSRVIKGAKAVTIKEDLKLGIMAVLDQMPRDLLERVGMVSLSTTLATNACVEDKGSRAKLILIGCDRDVVAKNGSQYGLPAIDDIIFLAGGHDSRGEVIAEPDWDELMGRIKRLTGKVDAFAVVQMWGIRNPEFEQKAKSLIGEATGLPVVCGHELSSQPLVIYPYEQCRVSRSQESSCRCQLGNSIPCLHKSRNKLLGIFILNYGNY